MKRIKKSKIPQWIAKRLPIGQEDEAISAVVVPIFMFLIMGISNSWFNWFNSKWVILWILGSILIIGVTLCIMSWIINQTVLLQKSREELIVSYKLESDPERKESIVIKLKELYVSSEEIESYLKI